jgi:hypothetical protein
MSSTSSPAHDVALCAAVADVVGALTRVGGLVMAGAADEVSGVRAAGLVAELVGALDVGEAAIAVLGRRADRSLELRAAGFASLRSYLVTGVGVSQGHANAVVARGRSLERYATTRDAVLNGEIGLDASRVIAEKVDHAVSDLTGEFKQAKRAEGEAVLLPLARVLPVDDVAAAGDKLMEVLDPQGRAERALRRFEQQSLACARVGDHYVVKGALPVDTGAGLVTILEAMVDQKFRTDSLRDDEQPTGDDVADARRRRLARPRLWAEAFDEIVQHVLADPSQIGLGLRHGNAPHLTVVIEQASLDAGLGGEVLVPGESTPLPLPHETVQRMLCHADVTEVVVSGMAPDSRYRAAMRDLARSDRATRLAASSVDPHDLVENCGHVLCVGRTYRTATKAQRTALMVRDRHCRFPGCRVDVHRCEAHHVLEWELGGATCLSNLVLLCRAHHVLVHEGGWRISSDPPLDPGHPDYWQFEPPDDRQYDSPLAGVAGVHLRHRRRPLAS